MNANAYVVVAHYPSIQKVVAVGLTREIAERWCEKAIKRYRESYDPEADAADPFGSTGPWIPPLSIVEVEVAE